MLRMASFPPDRQEIRRWFADHRREWLAGEAYRFAVELEGRMVGVVDVDGIAEREGAWAIGSIGQPGVAAMLSRLRTP